MTYGKITSTGQIQYMGNPFKLTVANPTETQKSLIAQLDNWLECVFTEQPPYNPETEYLVETWVAEQIEGKTKAVQKWEVKPIVDPEER